MEEYHIPLPEGGSLHLREEGPRIHALARLARRGAGLCKLWLDGPSGRALLGTPIPEGEGLILRRTLTLDSLRRQGAWPPSSARLIPASPAPDGAARPERPIPPPGWQPGGDAAAALADPLLRRWVRALADPPLIRPGADGFTLALPWQPGERFPLPGLFCLARPAPLGGRGFLLFSFSAQGLPCLPALGGPEG